MSLDLLQPFVRAQHTLWLSMKRITSRPATSAAKVFRTPAEAKSSNGIICVCRWLKALQMCSGVSIAHPLLLPSTKRHPPSPLSKVTGGRLLGYRCPAGLWLKSLPTRQRSWFWSTWRCQCPDICHVGLCLCDECLSSALSQRRDPLCLSSLV